MVTTPKQIIMVGQEALIAKMLAPHSASHISHARTLLTDAESARQHKPCTVETQQFPPTQDVVVG